MRTALQVVVRALTIASVLAVGASASAQTGVSDDRVNLPDGPGSIEGLGENVYTTGNMGQYATTLPIEIPRGFPLATPDLTLYYDSGEGTSELGFGWHTALQSIERTTVRGLPVYDTTDEFAADGGTQLVEIPGSDPPEYRARFEGGFVRYLWHERGDGAAGYWQALFPDGTVGFYGADADGALTSGARVEAPGGTFRYLLVERVDPFGHSVEYRYDRFGNHPLLTEIAYLFTEGDAQASITFAYSDDGVRADAVSDCKPGFCLVLEHRLERINVFAAGERYAYYDLSYEDYDSSGGFTRLVAVERFGIDDAGEAVPYPIVPTYAYGAALGAACDGDACLPPELLSFGEGLGVSLATGAASLIDINGDALPDIVDTGREGAHRFFVQERRGDGAYGFLDPIDSEIGTSSEHRLSDGHVQLLDVDGDGFTDMVNTLTGAVLQNGGAEGDWAARYTLGSLGGVDALDFELGDDGEPADVRFLDYDHDRNIDVVRSLPDTTQIYQSIGDGGFVVDESVATIGWGFAADRLQLEDMNGDGLPDPVRLGAGVVQYRLNLGFGQWGEVHTVDGLEFDADDLPYVELEDMNGDAVADLVIVGDSSVAYLLNRNGLEFDAPRTVSTVDGEPLPSRVDRTVLYADMNANGTTDVVWVDGGGQVTALDLFPARPNLLVQIDNGAGLATTIAYASSAAVAESAAHPLPFPMNVVTRTSSYDATSGLTEMSDFLYYDGYYDGNEKRFRGFGRVVETSSGADGVETASYHRYFDIGADAPQLAGRLLSTETYGEAGLLQVERDAYEPDCGVDGIGSAPTEPAIVFPCRTSREVEHVEGADEAERVTVRARYAYDGWGNITGTYEDGIVAIGGGPCEPCEGDGYGVCGDECTGDERHTEVVFVAPSDDAASWIVNLPATTTVSDGTVDGSRFVTDVHYDGDPHTGLALGAYARGLPSRRVAHLGEGIIELERNRFDDHGNVVETIDANGALDGESNRRRFTYDADGLNPTSVSIQLEDDTGAYALNRDIAYDPQIGLPSSISRWYVDGTPRLQTRTYDAHGRLATISEPGHDAPDLEFSWGFGEDGTLITEVWERSENGGERDMHTVTCLDGREQVMQVGRWTGDTYLVADAVERGARGAVVRSFSSFEASDPCAAPGASVPAESNAVDALGRLIESELPDASVYGTASVRREVRAPLEMWLHDALDTSSDPVASGTPTLVRTDGLGRVIEIERDPGGGAAPLRYSYAYDALGNVLRERGPLGHEKVQTFDEAGRLVAIDDPNSGALTFELDGAGNVVSRTDDRGVTVRSDYDGAQRLVARWDEADPEGTWARYTFDRSEACPESACRNGAGLMVGAAFAGTHGEGSDWFAYDARGNRTYQARTFDGVPFVVRTAFDDRNRVVSVDLPGAGAIDSEWDAAGRLVARNGFSFSYDTLGRRSEVGYPNGIDAAHGYDDRGRLISKGLGEGTLSVAYDRVGNVTEVGDGVTDGDTLSASYTYDALYHLTEAAFGSVETVSYAFDTAGRLSQRASNMQGGAGDLGDVSYGEFPAFAASTAGAGALSYDPSGHLILREQQTLDWDAFGRLESVRVGESDIAVFAYDGSRQRTVTRAGVRTTMDVTPAFRVEDGVGVTTVRVGRELLGESYDVDLAAQLLGDYAPADVSEDETLPIGDGRVTAADAWIAHAADEGWVAPLEDAPSASDALLASATRARLLGDTEVEFLHTDHLGSVVARSDDTGAVLARTGYYPHGGARFASRAGLEVYGVSGARSDAAGFVYFGLRYLDSDLGHWTAADPVFERTAAPVSVLVEQATDRYAFVAHNGASRFDPDGGIFGYVFRRTAHIAARNRRFRNGMLGGGLGMTTSFLRGQSTRQIMNAGKNGFQTGFQDGPSGILGHTFITAVRPQSPQQLLSVPRYQPMNLTFPN